MEFRILGPLEVVTEDGSVPLGGPKQRAVLAQLLLHANAAVSREQLADAVWGPDPPASATRTLQVYVHGLRKSLGADRIETAGTAYRARVQPGELDLERFDALVGRARAALAENRASAAADDLDGALALWRGAPLADLTGDGADAAARELDERRLSAVELRHDALLALGRHELVLSGLDRLVAENPYRERLRAQQVLALYRSGRQTEALEAYRAARDAWIDELGIEPSPELQELERRVLRHDPDLAPPAAPQRAASRLPVPPTPLVGRRLEAAAVGSLLRSQTRLVTLVGPGGTGKTRLALAVAEELAPGLEDGAAFVDLSGVFEPELFLATVAQALGVADTGPALPGALAEHLRDRALLLVLDNFEQILAAAPLLSDLLAAAPRLRALATSRAPLRLSGEHQYPVQPLPLPRPDVANVAELSQNEAVQLFDARARAVDPSFQLDERSAGSVAAICRRLDGLPLAIELAAARVNLLDPAAMLVRLEEHPDSLGPGPRDLAERQSTLAATIKWSCDLLPEREQRAFARLGIFAGGCTIEAAAEVCDVALDVLATLVDNSLLHRRPGAAGMRFAMLETVRRHSLDRLEPGEADEVRGRLAGWLTDLAESVEAAFPTSPDPAALLDTVEDEHDNIRAALGWALEAGEAEVALRIASALRPFWDVRGHLGEGERWVTQGLAAATERSSPLYAKSLGVAGAMAFHAGAHDLARERYEAMLEISRRLDDAEMIARALSDVGTVAAAVEDLDRATELLEESAARFRDLGERRRLAIVLGNLGHVAAQRDDYATAIASTTEALAIQQELGDRSSACVSLLNLGTSALETGDHAAARDWLRQCFTPALELGYKEVIAYALAALVRLFVAEGDFARAARLGGANERVLSESGVGLLTAPREMLDAAEEEARVALGDEAYRAARDEGRSVPVAELLAEAGLLERS